MAKAKKTAPKPAFIAGYSPPVPGSPEPPEPSLPRLQTNHIARLLETSQAAVRESTDNLLVTQSVLAAYLRAKRQEAEVTASLELLKAFLRDRKDSPVEPGNLRLEWSVTSRTTPSWKSIALDNARELAELRGKVWSEELYESEVKQRTPSTITNTPNVIEG